MAIYTISASGFDQAAHDIVNHSAVPGVGGPVGFGWIPLTGMAYKTAIGANLPIGNNDLYTAPAGKRAIIIGQRVYNSSAGSITWFPQIKVSGSYYKLASGSTATTGSGGTQAINSIILEPGESYSINTTTTAGLNCRASVIEYDNTVAFFTAKILSPASGDNTLYTVPNGKSAILMPTEVAYTTDAFSQIVSFNATGGSLNVIYYIVPSGQAVGNSYRLTPAMAAGANGKSLSTLPNTTMTAGEFIVVNWSGLNTNGISFANIMEI